MSKSLISKVSFKIIRNVLNIEVRNILCVFIRFFIPKQEIFKRNEVLNFNLKEKQIYDELEKSGMVKLGKVIDDNKLELILKKISALQCYELKSKISVDINNVNENIQLAHYKREDLSQIPEIISLANDSRILNVVSRYFKAKPIISNISSWWSFSDKDTAKEAQLFHRDVDDYKFLKLFFYLTDVDEESGPHIYVRGSHKVNKLLKIKRYNDNEVEKQFGKDKIERLCGEKGNSFLEDTFGVHKGELPNSKNRLLLQIQYSYLPLRAENYNPVKSELLDRLGLDKYVNKLLFKS